MARNIGFDKKAFDILMRYEDWHWWFQFRNKLIIDTIRKFSKTRSEILEIGCGNGLVTKEIRDKFPESKITATEYFEDGLKNARARLSDVNFRQLDARDMDESDKFDIVCAFDVLEHIDADIEVMKAIRRSMKDENSRFYITVPQHMSFWSQADIFAKHERRYSIEEMKKKLIQSEFVIEYKTSYVFLLAPLMYFSRIFNKDDENYSIQREFEISRLSNSIFSGVMRFEAALRNFGLPMPFGGSLVVVAKPV